MTDRLALFVGESRTGHTFVAALLACHPEVLAANEYDPLRSLRWNPDWDGDTLIQDWVDEARKWNLKSGPYRYRFDGFHQRTCDKLGCLVAASAGRNSRSLREDPHAIGRLSQVCRRPVKVIRMLRHPQDVISTQFLRQRSSLDRLVWRFISRDRICRRAQEAGHGDWLTLYHERLIANPQTQLRRIFAHLELDTDSEFIEELAALVYARPNRSRDRVDWPDELYQKLHDAVSDIPEYQPYFGGSLHVAPTEPRRGH